MAKMMGFNKGMGHIFSNTDANKSPIFQRSLETLGEGGGASHAASFHSKRRGRAEAKATLNREYDSINEEVAMQRKMNIGATTDNDAARFQAANKTYASTIANSKLGYMDMAGEVGKALWAGDATQKAIKAGVVGGAWMTGSALMRGASGGGLTYNSSGERDIMGIPLI